MNKSIKNAKIVDAKISLERGMFLTINLALDYGGSRQAFGGIVLAKTDKEPTVLPCIWLLQLLAQFEVESFSGLVGLPCRVYSNDNKVYRIGHFLKDVWFDPEDADRLMARIDAE